MSVKKLFILTAAGVASLGMSAAMAGGPDMMAAPAPVETHYYVEGSLGYAYQDFSDVKGIDGFFQNGNFAFFGSAAMSPQGNNATGGFAYGADFGYMFNRYIGAELGWTHLPSSSGTSRGFDFIGLNVRHIGAAWLVAKIVAPLADHFDLFLKAGVSYRYGTLLFVMTLPPVNGPFIPSTAEMREWRPVLGAGLTYNISDDWMASLSWMHFVGGTSYTAEQMSAVRFVSILVPPSDVIALNIGYKFAV